MGEISETSKASFIVWEARSRPRSSVRADSGVCRADVEACEAVSGGRAARLSRVLPEWEAADRLGLGLGSHADLPPGDPAPSAAPGSVHVFFLGPCRSGMCLRALRVLDLSQVTDTHIFLSATDRHATRFTTRHLPTCRNRRVRVPALPACTARRWHPSAVPRLLKIRSLLS